MDPLLFSPSRARPIRQVDGPGICLFVSHFHHHLRTVEIEKKRNPYQQQCAAVASAGARRQS
ncbi:hypothetical protein BC826DRAFT_1031861, partial [Russula brevipes]